MPLICVSFFAGAHLLADFLPQCAPPGTTGIESGFPVVLILGSRYRAGQEWIKGNPISSNGCGSAGTRTFTISPPVIRGIDRSATKVVHSEISAVAGGGAAHFPTGIKVCADVGVILRYFLDQSHSLKIDFRNYIFFDTYTKNNIVIALIYAFHLGGAPEGSVP